MSKFSENELIIHTLTKPEAFSSVLFISICRASEEVIFRNYLFLTVGFKLYMNVSPILGGIIGIGEIKV